MAIRIALAGNPNSGKTTLFNALTGSNQFVGNWPGVTVEKKEGKLKGNDDVTVTDLPGIYSLSPYTPEEIVARDYLIGERPDVILNIVDGTNLERNLFLTTQLTEIGIPVVVAVNMMDVILKNGDKIDTARLSYELACAVTEISALKGGGTDNAVAAAIEAAGGAKTVPQHSFSGGVEHTLAHIEEYALHDLPQEQQRFFAIKLFERDKKIAESLGLSEVQLKHIEDDIKRREEKMEDDSESIITAERYQYIDSVVKNCAKYKSRSRVSVSEKIDRVATNRFLALPVFALVMFAVYFVSVTVAGTFAADLVGEGLFGGGFNFFGKHIPGIPAMLEAFLETVNCAEWLKALITDGIAAGVGAVLGFLPQMFILFLFLSFLEACGYMSRIAFILDRIFRRFGLSGKSFIPILIGTGCGVPGIMASRTVENECDRRMTIITTTFIPCSAKLPVIALIAGAVFGGGAWVTASAYFAGIAAIVCSGIILKKTRFFSGDVSPFVMELPAYHMPTFRSIIRNTWDRSWSFIKKAGTIILLATVFIWFASNFGNTGNGFGSVPMQDSILAEAGGFIAPIFAPLGWGNWQPAVSSLTGLIAKENVVGTFGILYGFTESSLSGGTWERLAADFTKLSAYSFLIFNLLCAPCFAAIGAIRKEMNSRKWFWAAIGYQSVFAYFVSLCIYQFGMLISKGVFGLGTAAAFVLIAGFLYLLLRPARKETGS